jgi:dihydrodipicolinate synthase/N-acetylneuraminate lyase
MKTLKGIIPPLPTSFHPDKDLYPEKIRENIRILMEHELAGTGGQSTRETIQLTRITTRHAADAALVLNPFYYRGLISPELLALRP